MTKLYLTFKFPFLLGFLFSFGALFLSSNMAQNVNKKLQKASTEPIKVFYDKQLKTPQFITGNFAYPQNLNKVEVAKQFLSDHSGFLKIPSSSKFELEKTSIDKLNNSTILRLKQKVGGISIFGSDIAIHITNNNEIKVFNGKIYNIKINTVPSLNRYTAINIAKDDLGIVSKNKSVKLNGYVKNGGGLLTWHIVLLTNEQGKLPGEWHYFIDAHNGKLVSKFNNIKDIKSRKTYTANNGTTLPGTLLINEGGSSTDAVAQAAQDNAGFTYDYYFNTFGRDSYDNQGATITSTVHYSNNYNNAYWNGTQMVYGDGDGTQFAPLSLALDVVAHELTHAVTERTANLVYQDQSGALNESMSDVFGVLIDSTNWKIGEDVYTPGTPGDALRYMDNPTLGNQPDNMSNYLVTTSDNGGVHTNSGITNKAFYNVATAIGRHSAGQIYYRALTTYFTASTDFQAARVALVQAATDLYGAASAEVTAVENGFDAVGITAPPVDFTGTFVSSSYSTPHPYSNSQTYTKTFSHPGATGMKVSFSSFDTESGYDFVKIKDGTGTVLYNYSGNKGVFVSGPVNGDVITVELTSDNSVTKNGFDIDGYYYNGGSTDTTPPVISTVASSSITANSATITWTTNEASNSQVEYGLTTSYGNSTTLDVTKVTSHSVSLSGLTAGTTYHYRVKSTDAAGNSAVSSDYWFTATSGATSGNYEPNDSFAQAATINYGVTIRSYIQSNGDIDYFKFTIPKGGAINVKLANFPGDYDVYLYNSSQSELGRGYTTSDPEIIDYTASAAGTFYVKVNGYQSAYSSTDDYELTITFTPTAAAQWYYINRVMETAHPYANNTNITQTYSQPGAQKVAVHFVQFETELNYDFVYIKDKNNSTIATHHGTKTAFWAEVTGDQINVNFVSDYSVTKWGYKIDQVAYYSTSQLINNGIVATDGVAEEVKVAGTLVHINNEKGNPVDKFAVKKNEENVIIPTEFKASAYPNPFNPSTNIKFSIPISGQYSLKVYNILGQEVKTLVNKDLAAGIYNVLFDASRLASGIYIYRLSGNNVKISQKIILAK